MKKVFLILLICLILIGGLFFYLKFLSVQGFSVTFFNVGQGDATLINFGNDVKMLVDCGPDRKILSKLGQTLPFYDRTIDYLVVSHPDLDHYGGCVDVLKRYKVNEVIINGERKDSDQFFQIFDQEIKNQRSKIKIINGDESLKIGGSVLEFLAPDTNLNLSAKNNEGNNLSIVFRLIHGNDKFLFTGDAEIPLEQALVAKYCITSSTSCSRLQSDYLKIGHHGSDSSSGDDFLNTVSPRTAIISVGKNSFGHPSLRVLHHLERAGINTWRTNEKNDIIVK